MSAGGKGWANADKSGQGEGGSILADILADVLYG